MPTFTKMAWETLLEPAARDSLKTPLNSGQKIPKSSSSVVDDGNGSYKAEETKKKTVRAQTPNHIYISPALYITPAPAPIPDSSSDPVSPSPYVVNHKRRGGGCVGGVVKSRDGERSTNSNGDCDEVVEEEEEEVVVVVDDDVFGAEVGGGDGNGGSVDFFDLRGDSASVASSVEVEEFGKQQAECRSCVSNQGEFFDAHEDFSSDGSISNLSSSYGPRIESELRAAKLTLLEEIERQKAAEHAVAQMYSQWQRLASLLSQTGLTFPTPPDATGMQLEIDSLEQCCQELEVTRFVADAIGRGQARAEAEMAAELVIGSKDQEISRLRDRVQYYEAVNHEMSQRNQEVMEVARRQRQRKQNQRKWIWGCIGLSVAIGTSVIAYSYLPHSSKHHTLPTSDDSSDTSHVNPAESAQQ